MNTLEINLRITHPTPKTACDLLAERSGLSKTRIKHAMTCGAVWFGPSFSKQKRLRRATKIVHPGHALSLYYDPAILDLAPPAAICLRDFQEYSIWYKPVGLMTQGTRYGDHCALSRQVELFFKNQRSVNLVHRLDREVGGLVLIAHGQKPAALFSDLLRRHSLHKQYQLKVMGNLSRHAESGVIDLPLDGKSAKTFFKLVKFDAANNQSVVQVKIETGRRHQIRRHFAEIGYPVIGDPCYGHGNKNQSGLQLVAFEMAFQCPLGHGPIELAFDPESTVADSP